MGVVVKASFRWWNTELAVDIQDRDLGLLRSMVVSGEEILLKLALKQE